MALPARKIEADFMEERIARLETHTEHLRENLHRVEAKVDRLDAKVDRLDAKIDSVEKRLEDKIDALEKKLEAKIDALRNSLVAFQLETKDMFAQLMKSRMTDKIWWLLIAAALLGVMARGFKWI